VLPNSERHCCSDKKQTIGPCESKTFLGTKLKTNKILVTKVSVFHTNRYVMANVWGNVKVSRKYQQNYHNKQQNHPGVILDLQTPDVPDHHQQRQNHPDVILDL
jgi:hypothetical protein